MASIYNNPDIARLEKDIADRTAKGFTSDLKKAQLNNLYRQGSIGANMHQGTRPAMNGTTVQGPMNINAQGTGTQYVAGPKPPVADVANQAGTTNNQTVAYDPSKDLEALKQAQIARIQNNLTNRYNQVVADISSKRANVAPEYEQRKLGAQSGSQLQAKNFAEFLANRGLSRSGTSQQAELMRNMQLQGTLGQLDKQMNDELTYLQKQQDDARRAYNNDMTNAEQQSESDYLTQLIQAKARQDETRRAEAWKQKEYEAMIARDELNATQKKYDMDKAKRTDAEDAFTKSITGLGNSMDYQAEINRVRDDGDPTNDWQIPILTRERQNKINTNLTKEIAGIGQYYNDFQAEINRRKATPDKLDDMLIPYLEAERAKKVEGINKAQASQYEADKKRAFEIFKLTGIATPEIAALIGVDPNTATPEYMRAQYDVNRPYSKADGGDGIAKTGIGSSKNYAKVNNEIFKLLSDGYAIDAKNPQAPWAAGGSSAYKTQGRTEYNYVYGLLMNSGLSPEEIQNISNTYGIPL